ncbi:U32 family peptidase [Magnetospira sp. QH-2]|uniref:ubiquinone anaerobic biosynthesis protein UbiV n=1 Tax=Magnetospira sp. (strain QH-2) TaxID=1288970 RepID=UPI0003E81859|nr:U32 family peptidase [Magnetospira sp. QH-2]CCQ75245.1 putative peptidase U32 [Magnetospira sp. QH-2]
MSGKLTLGPVYYNWEPERWRDFYFRIADEAPVNTVCLGEVVCSKRQPFLDPVLPEAIERLQAAGKEVLLSTLALIMSEREEKQVRALCTDSEIMVEANDLSAVSFLTGRPHTVGPLVNVYNEGTLSYLARNGATRVSLPGELSSASLRALAAAELAELEVQVFGRLPLAISARCYHARSRELHKDSCQYVCSDDPDGMDLDTMDGEPFLAVNGTQTLSYTYVNLVRELPELARMGINHYRLAAQDMDMVAVAQAYRRLLDGHMEAAEAIAELDDLSGGVPFSNGYYHGTDGVAAVGDLAVE